MAAEQLIDAGQQYYILATEVPVAERTLVLKQDDTFAVFNDFGDVDAEARYEEGLYHGGTRFLSRLTLTLASHRLLLLSSTVRRDNVLMAVDLTNPDLYVNGSLVLPRGTLHINRSKVIWHEVCYELIRVRNFALATVAIDLAVRFAADYADIFEVRGQKRSGRGHPRAARIEPGRVTLGYEGLDQVVRETTLECHPAPDVLEEDEMHFRLQLGSRGEKTMVLAVGCRVGSPSLEVLPFEHALSSAETGAGLRERLTSTVETSNPQFNAWLRCSGADLGMMLTSTQHGLYPYAGVPWFDTTFGRDGILTAFETLWLWPEIARGVLAFLAATQAQVISPERDSEPGKILHEARRGEMAALNEIPFGRYYGSVDATPLFVMLAGAYYQRTSDLEFISRLWPSIQAALEWIDRYGDIDHDGFVEYHRRSASGLVQQGWKDSHDSVFHSDGRIAEGPIALCEVQGYVYAARLGAAEIALALGDQAQAGRLREAAGDLKRRFEAQFWCPEIDTYALAIDGEKNPCRVRTSNPGHCLLTGIASSEHARAVLAGFGEEHFFSGWGVRTVAESELRYNPMSYHNGSIWPHDNALVAAGASRYQAKAFAARILGAQFEAATFFDLNRLPELFCGFRRRHGEGPTRYPVACSPQAWASATVFMLLEAVLGISIDAVRGQVVLNSPALPPGLERVHVRDLAVADGSVDILVQRYAGSVGVNVERRSGKIDVIVHS
jgi:glycogen debranching enzyme